MAPRTDGKELKRLRGLDISSEIESYFLSRGLALEPMQFDFNDEDWSREENLMLRMYVHLNTDAEGCFENADGVCVSPNQCVHADHNKRIFSGKQTMNTDNILLVASHIDKVDPEQFSMAEWECETHACIGGWCERIFPDGRDAADILGISTTVADRLFYPRPGRCPEIEEDSPLDIYIWSGLQPTQAGDVLRHLAATGKVDWSIVQLPKA